MYLGPLRYVRTANVFLSYLHGKPKNMQVLRSPFFYLPIVVLFAVNSNLQDIGLWQRMAAWSVVALIAMGATLKAFRTRFTIIEGMLLALVLWPILKISAVDAASELWGHVARMAVLFGTTVIAANAFKIAEEETLRATSVGAQIALSIAALSILPSLNEAYSTGDMYLAKGTFFTHKNYAAATLLMWIPAALIKKLPGTAGVWLQRTSIALAVLLIMFLRTRGVWLAAAIMTLVAFAYFGLQKNGTYRNQSLIAMGVLVLGVAFAIALGGTEKIFDSSTVQSRMHYWKASKEMFLDNPITGVGAGQWKINYPATGLKGTNESVMNGTTAILRPHNDFLWLLSETGIGALLFLAVILLSCWSLRNSRDQFFMGLTIVAFVSYGFGEFPLERATLLLPLAIALGYASSLNKSLFESGKAPALLLSSVMLLFTLTVSAGRISGEKQAAKALDGYMSRNSRTMINHSAKAMGPFFEMDIYNNPMPYFEGLGTLIAGGKKPSKKVLTKSADMFEEALRIHPNHILSLNQLAQIRRMERNYDEASALYNRVLKMSPRNTTAALKLVEVERQRGDIYASLDALKKLDKKYTPENLPGLGREATQTLRAFAAMNNPRPASKSLHTKLQGKKAGRLWQIWQSSRRSK